MPLIMAMINGIALNHACYPTRNRIQVFVKLKKIHHVFNHTHDQAWNHNSHPNHASDAKENNF